MRVLSLLATLVIASTTTAEEFTSTSQSEVSFQARTTFHDFAGRSTEVSAHFTLTEGTIHSAGVAVPVGSIHTGNDSRDRDMIAEKFLDQKNHPQILFESDTFAGPPIAHDKDGKGQLQGTLKIRGQSKQVVIPVRYQWEAGTLSVDGDLPIDIRDFGMTPPSVVLVQKMDPVVQMRFHLVFPVKT